MTADELDEQPPYILVELYGATSEQVDAMVDLIADVAFANEPEGVMVGIASTMDDLTHSLVPRARPRDPATLTDDDLPTMSEAEEAAYYLANAHRLHEIFDYTKTVEFEVRAKPTFTATATREGKWWVLDVEGVGATQIQTLRRARPIVRDMVSAVLDIPKDRFDVQVIRYKEAP